MRKVKYISVPPYVIKEIVAIEKVHRNSVYAALRYTTSGERPDRIRQLARERGGIDAYKIVR